MWFLSCSQIPSALSQSHRARHAVNEQGLLTRILCPCSLAWTNSLTTGTIVSYRFYDLIILSEGIKQGYSFGYDDGYKAGYEEGWDLGKVEGEKLGNELGLILANCLILKKRIASTQVDTKRLDKIIEIVKEFPMENTETDREGMINRLRAKYREARQGFTALAPLPDDNAAKKSLEF